MIGEDKFAVVAIVMAIIFCGLAVYLILLDRKLTRIEKKQQELLTNKNEPKKI
ncbi:MAG: CcmD family protein [Omnitrophica WOR_2 bacterium]|jgi:CcmD family protein